MDRIERAEDSASNGSPNPPRPPTQEVFPTLPEETGSQQQPATRPLPRLRHRNRQPSIRLRRLSSASSLGQQETAGSTEQFPQLTPQATTEQKSNIPLMEQSQDDSWEGNRRRSNSEPRPGRYSSPPIIVTSGIPISRQHPMSPVKEETGSIFRPSTDLNNAERLAALRDISLPATGDGGTPAQETLAHGQTLTRATPRLGMLRRASVAALSAIGRNRASTVAGADPARHAPAPDEYDSRIVDFLDVIDPEISTLSTLTNVQNSLFVPDLGPLLNRMPTYTLTRRPSKVAEGLDAIQKKPEPVVAEEPLQTIAERPPLVSSMASALGPERFAILPDGVTLDGWTQEDIEELNDHVRHMLHSRRSKFKRAMKGFGQYVRRPLGFLVTLYATLITLFGLAWVLFLIGWINVGGKQLYVINVIDNVLVALFAIMGDGLAPFRAVDTYHMIFIAHYHHLTWRLRKKRTLPDLADKNDLPSRRPEDVVDLERDGDPATAEKGPLEYSILTPLQQQRLEHHQRKFAKSHTFYKPHETLTHHAFPLRMLVAIVVILDCHSLFQIALGVCTWSISYHVRPFALTTVILCCSITCNITGGVLISIGDRITRKKDVVERIARQGLTCEAMKKVEKRKMREVEQNRTSMDIAEPYHDA
ncbi:integral membrane protein [Talaromyces marneffei ATCC 18224]|uniref:Integral membrane protein n=1 Tax=Talaromyces marneffei (strain ATCC 18224 / CBS 334.59 / QM 7333) TaxID=441960 RepID=B6Q1U2_TALMQ|nr:integral membrane protein [Talaromyces marneffei ATCC 18224]